MMNFRRLKETYLYNHKSLTPATLWTIFLKLVIFNIWCPLVHYERLIRGAVWLKFGCITHLHINVEIL